MELTAAFMVLLEGLHGGFTAPSLATFRLLEDAASFADMLTTLRRASWEDQFHTVRQPPTVWSKAVARLTFLATLAG